MPPYSDRTRYELGDEVSNGSEQGVIVLSDFASGKTSKRLPMVKIIAGDRTGQKVWPWEKPHRWFPLLDYQPRTAKFRCTECDRDYWAPKSMGWCRQCVKKDEAANTGRVTGSRTFSRIGAAPNFQPAPVTANATKEQRERVDRGRVQKDDAPF